MDLHRKTNRLAGYDYSQSGYYFITICIDNKLHLFGKIKNGISVLNHYGFIVEYELKKISLRYSYIKIDQYIIMPDHLHVILYLKETQQQTIRTGISSVIGTFKSVTSRRIHKDGLKKFVWQRSFHDRIIRDETELFFKREYIQQNPLRAELKKINKCNPTKTP
jgi:REP element-mobilizing transposase RayT